MSATIVGTEYVFGVPDEDAQRITNLPAGATAELVLRNDEFACANVRLTDGTELTYILARENGALRLELLQKETRPFGSVFRAIVIAPYLKGALALYWLLTPARRVVTFLADDCRSYRRMLDDYNTRCDE